VFPDARKPEITAMAETGIINPAIEAVTINKCFLHTACVYIQPYMQAVFLQKNIQNPL
jgi:hypothetical protein